MKRILATVLLSALLLPVTTLGAVTPVVSESERASIVQFLIAQIATLQAQIAELKKEERETVRAERNKVVPYFELTERADGTIDGSEEFTLATFKVTARSKDLDASKFTSGSYVFREVQLVRANHPVTTVEKTIAPISQKCSSTDGVILEGKSKTCKVKMSPLPPGDYKYVIKNPSIGSAKTEMIVEGELMVR